MVDVDIDNIEGERHTMTPSANAPARLLRRLWQASPLLTFTGLLMVPALAIALLGLWLDSRTILGAPAWLKPAKFAVSIGIFSLTLAWVLSFLPEWPRLRRWVGIVNAVVFPVEIAIIDLQAWRGTTSHFNNATTLDGALFSIMGVAIAVQTLASVAVAVALWRQAFADRAMGWALRLGMVITIAGAATGGLMTRPTPDQMAAMREGRPAPIVGAHTVGAPDGGPGLPVTGWSTRHGDLRVAHFVGLHALQVLPILTLVAFRGRGERARLRLTLAAASAYALVYITLLVQALSGAPLVALG
jgi:hypothetical protein